jgi:hypothetical protein
MSWNLSYSPLSRSASVAALLAAVVLSVGSLGCVLGLFNSAGSQPWLSSNSAALVQHCDAKRSTVQREGCVRQAIAKQAASATVRVAAR